MTEVDHNRQLSNEHGLHDARDHDSKNHEAGDANEKNTMKIIERFFSQNLNLSTEINSLSDQLPKLLAKEKEKAKSKANSKQDLPNHHDEGLQKELNDVYNQMQGYQRELKAFQAKYASSATFERYKDLENQAIFKDKEIEKLVADKKALERSLAEKEKAVENLKNETGSDVKVPLLQKELKELKKKLKEMQAKEKEVEAVADKDNAEVAKYSEELNKVRENYRIMLDKTGYDPKADKFRPKVGPLAPAEKKPAKQARFSSLKKDQDEEAWDLEFNQTNFQKLYDEVAKSKNEPAGKDNRKEIESLKERINVLKKESEKSQKKLSEREKEANVLAIKLRELHRIARYHSILPNELDESPVHSREIKNFKISSPSKIGHVGSPLNNKGSLTVTNKNRLARLESSISYTRNPYLYNGYRKEERGKAEGEAWSDKDLVGSAKPKIIGLKVWHDNRRIVGFQAVYQTGEKVVDGAEHVQNPQAYKLESLELSEDDYLTEISGFTNKAETAFECIMLMSAKGETKKILEPTKDAKLFKFNINGLEFPSIICGYIKEDAPRHYVSKFGVLIASTDGDQNLKNEASEQAIKVQPANNEKSATQKKETQPAKEKREN